jgi:gamma-glutamylcyclotransferase (GGCT)/AIG2-like uncharacterized protein YtfP
MSNADKQKLFIYGTLKDRDIGRALFGGQPHGTSDVLEGFTKTVTDIHGVEYPNIAPQEGGEVAGEVIEVNDETLKHVDAYETEAYDRRMVTLKSGTQAWAYIRE